MHRSRTPFWFVLAGLVVILTSIVWFSMSSGSALAGKSSVDGAEQINAPVTDLVVDAIEVTQTIQDLNNSVPLVEGKRTFVRVYVHSTIDTYPTTALLQVESGVLHQTLLPIAPGGPFINVRPTYSRLMPTHAFLFELPLWSTFVNSLTLTAEVNPDMRWHPRNPEEFSYANNSLATSVSFDFVPKLYLVVADQPYTFMGNSYAPAWIDHYMLNSWVRRAYPLSQVKVYFRSLPSLAAKIKQNEFGGWDITYPNCSLLNSYMAFQRANILGSPFFTNDTAFYAMVPDNIGFMRGCAPIGGQIVNFNKMARVASGPSGAGNWGWDFDGSYADWYGGHEIGHSFGQAHVRGGPGIVKDGCGGEAGAVKQYANGRISPTINFFDPSAIFGFDTQHLLFGINPILGPSWVDMMTYCDYQWISKPTYVNLKNVFEYALPLNLEAITDQPTAQDVLAVYGTLDPHTREVVLQPVSTLFDVLEVTPPTPGPYAIVLRQADGNELARHPFTPIGLDQGAALDEGLEPEVAYISELVSYIAGVTQLEIENSGGVLLYQVSAGITLPAVQVTAPNGGEVLEGESILVTWTASDEDGDPLTFNVEYSPNNGETWDQVALFITDTQVTIDQVNLPASDTSLIRVSASDGIHSSRDSSDGVFAIPNHLPTGEIIAPTSDVTIAVSQTITFEGWVYDIDLGKLDEENLQWVSDRDGSLGNADILSTASLSAGLHEINLIADDGQGQTFIDQVIVMVVASPNDLPPLPDALVAGPDLVYLYPASDIFTAWVYLDNLNLGNPIAWQASPNMDWVELSSDSGLTPQDVIVTTSLTVHDFGTHKSLITFSSPEGIFDPVYIVVVVTVSEYKHFLPVLLR